MTDEQWVQDYALAAARVLLARVVLHDANKAARQWARVNAQDIRLEFVDPGQPERLLCDIEMATDQLRGATRDLELLQAKREGRTA